MTLSGYKRRRSSNGSLSKLEEACKRSSMRTMVAARQSFRKSIRFDVAGREDKLFASDASLDFCVPLLMDFLSPMEAANLRLCSKALETAVQQNVREFQLKASKHCPERINDSVILRVVKMLPSLTSLSLIGCANLTDKGVEYIKQHATNLTSLELIYCRKLSDKAFLLISEITKLQSLKATFLPEVTDVGIGALAGLSSLQNLHIGLGMRVTDRGFEKLIVRSENAFGNVRDSTLKKVEIANCSRITDRTPQCLSQLPTLESIVLRDCQNLTDASLTSLCTLRRLQALNLRRCTRISNDKSMEMARASSSLKSITVPGGQTFTQENGTLPRSRRMSCHVQSNYSHSHAAIGTTAFSAVF